MSGMIIVRALSLWLMAASTPRIGRLQPQEMLFKYSRFPKAQRFSENAKSCLLTLRAAALSPRPAEH
jgi:hypothetical protein